MSKEFDARLGRCYELASREVTDRDSTLIHGTISRNDSPPNPHAWVRLSDGQCWEPILQMTMPEKAFNRYFGVVIHKEFTRLEAMHLMLRTHTYGPWTEAEVEQVRALLLQES